MAEGECIDHLVDVQGSCPFNIDSQKSKVTATSISTTAP